MHLEHGSSQDRPLALGALSDGISVAVQAICSHIQLWHSHHRLFTSLPCLATSLMQLPEYKTCRSELC
jgi:hypothetical protein